MLSTSKINWGSGHSERFDKKLKTISRTYRAFQGAFWSCLALEKSPKLLVHAAYMLVRLGTCLLTEDRSAEWVNLDSARNSDSCTTFTYQALYFQSEEGQIYRQCNHLLRMADVFILFSLPCFYSVLLSFSLPSPMLSFYHHCSSYVFHVDSLSDLMNLPECHSSCLSWMNTVLWWGRSLPSSPRSYSRPPFAHGNEQFLYFSRLNHTSSGIVSQSTHINGSLVPKHSQIYASLSYLLH